jgi:hypothetical protein
MCLFALPVSTSFFFSPRFLKLSYLHIPATQSNFISWTLQSTETHHKQPLFLTNMFKKLSTLPGTLFLPLVKRGDVFQPLSVANTSLWGLDSSLLPARSGLHHHGHCVVSLLHPQCMLVCGPLPISTHTSPWAPHLLKRTPTHANKNSPFNSHLPPDNTSLLCSISQ